MLSKKDGVPLPFIVVIIYREVQDVSLFIVVPVLASISRKYRMFYRKGKISSRCQPAVNFFYDRLKIFDIVKCERT